MEGTTPPPPRLTLPLPLPLPPPLQSKAGTLRAPSVFLPIQTLNALFAQRLVALHASTPYHTVCAAILINLWFVSLICSQSPPPKRAKPRLQDSIGGKKWGHGDLIFVDSWYNTWTTTYLKIWCVSTVATYVQGLTSFNNTPVSTDSCACRYHGPSPMRLQYPMSPKHIL